MDFDRSKMKCSIQSFKKYKIIFIIQTLIKFKMNDFYNIFFYV